MFTPCNIVILQGAVWRIEGMVTEEYLVRAKPTEYPLFEGREPTPITTIHAFGHILTTYVQVSITIDNCNMQQEQQRIK